MLSVPTVAQMLTVIGLAFVAAAVVTAGVTLLLDRLTTRTAGALNAAGAVSPVQTRPSVPSQRTAVPSTHRVPVTTR